MRSEAITHLPIHEEYFSWGGEGFPDEICAAHNSEEEAKTGGFQAATDRHVVVFVRAQLFSDGAMPHLVPGLVDWLAVRGVGRGNLHLVLLSHHHARHITDCRAWQLILWQREPARFAPLKAGQLTAARPEHDCTLQLTAGTAISYASRCPAPGSKRETSTTCPITTTGCQADRVKSL